MASLNPFISLHPAVRRRGLLKLSRQGVGTRITHIPRLQPGTFPRLVNARALAPGWVWVQSVSFSLCFPFRKPPPPNPCPQFPPQDTGILGLPTAKSWGLILYIQDDPTLPCPLS